MKNKIFNQVLVTLLMSFSVIIVPFVGHSAKENHGAYGKDWNYDNPENWKKVNSVCGGSKQSPINIDTQNVKKGKIDKKIYYTAPKGKEITNKGYIAQLDFAPGNKMMYKGKEYQLLQLHYHADAEHTIGEKQYPLELHLVHQNKEGGLAVIGIFFEKGKANTTFQSFLNAIPKNKMLTKYSKDMPIADILPKKSPFYSYQGSLTTPGCSENVEWIVMEKPLQVSEAQIAQFLGIRDGKKNNRPVQTLGNRVIMKSE